MNALQELEKLLNFGEYTPTLRVKLEVDRNLEKTLVIRNEDEHNEIIRIDCAGCVEFFNGVTLYEISKYMPTIIDWLKIHIGIFK